MEFIVLISFLTENLSALYPLILSLFIIIGLLFSIPKATQFLARSTEDNSWIEQYKKIRFSLIMAVLCAGLSELAYDIEAHPLLLDHPDKKGFLDDFAFYKKLSSHVLLFLCMLMSFRIFRSTKNTLLLISTLLLFFIYESFAIWGVVPFFWDGIDRIQQGTFGSTLAIPISILVMLLVQIAMKWIVSPILKKTKTEIDDQLFSYIKNPLQISIFLIGLGAASADMHLGTTLRDIFHSCYLSVAVFIWSRASFQVSHLILMQLENKKEQTTFIQPRTIPIFSLVSRMLITVVSVYCFLIAWDKDPSAWIASAGIIGIAVAYASQDTLASLLAGFAILTDAPYKIDDFLVLENGSKGQVTHIGFRSTRILTPEHVEIVIPNSIMSSTAIINMSGGKERYARIDCSAGVAYGSDIDQVRTILFEIAKELDNLVEESEATKPKVHFISMGASSLDFVLRIWIADPANLLDVQDQANTLIYKRFTAANIEIPYSKQDVYLYNMSKS